MVAALQSVVEYNIDIIIIHKIEFYNYGKIYRSEIKNCTPFW